MKSGLKKLLGFYFNGDLMSILLRMGGGSRIVFLYFGLKMFLVPEFKPGSNIVLKASINFREPEALVAALEQVLPVQFGSIVC